MRSGAQITRTPRQWKEHQEEERRRALTALLYELRRARAAGAEWYKWIEDGCPRLTPEEYERRQADGATRPRRRRSAPKT